MYILLSTFVVTVFSFAVPIVPSILAVSNVSVVPSSLNNMLEYAFSKFAPLSKYIVELFANFK